MKKKSPKSIYDFDLPISAQLPSYQQHEVMEILNLLYVGNKHVNRVLENGMLVGKYDDHPNFKKLVESHYAVAGSYRLNLKMGIDKKGRLFIKGFKE
jgi:hypothetical protein